MKWVLEELLEKMNNTVKIVWVTLISAVLSACGQSGPLYMPGQATGVHKKDVFVLDDNPATQAKTPATKSKAPDTTKPAPKTSSTAPTPAASDSTSSSTEQQGVDLATAEGDQ